jgi:hypothetical protein
VTTKRLADLVREAEETTDKVRALTDRAARQTAEVDAFVAAQLRLLNRAAAILAAERERTASGLRPKIVLPPAVIDPARDTSENDDDA